MSLAQQEASLEEILERKNRRLAYLQDLLDAARERVRKAKAALDAAKEALEAYQKEKEKAEEEQGVYTEFLQIPPGGKNSVLSSTHRTPMTILF